MSDILIKNIFDEYGNYKYPTDLPSIPTDASGTGTPSPWHIGTPTEDGYYLCHFTDGDRTFDACFPFTNGAWDIGGYGLNPYTFEVIAWQKIEPYKEASE